MCVYVCVCAYLCVTYINSASNTALDHPLSHPILAVDSEGIAEERAMAASKLLHSFCFSCPSMSTSGFCRMQRRF